MNDTDRKMKLGTDLQSGSFKIYKSFPIIDE